MYLIYTRRHHSLDSLYELFVVVSFFPNTENHLLLLLILSLPLPPGTREREMPRKEFTKLEFKLQHLISTH